MFERGDGTGRELRPAQEYVLAQLRAVWHTEKPIVILGQTGLGKSMIARTIQLESNAAIVTPQNTLIRQYVSDYPELNYWWGESHFTCHKKGYHVSDCEFTQNRLKAIEHEHTVFNPMSLYYLRRAVRSNLKPHPVTVIDEAHAVLSMLRNLSTIELDMKDVPAPHKLEVTYNLREWLQKKLDEAREKFDAYATADHTHQMKMWNGRIRKYSNLIHGLDTKDELYSIKYNHETNKLHVQCVILPPHIVDYTFGPGRKILMSGTIFRSDITELLGTEDYHLIEPPSAIPKENRKILFEPTPFPVNYKTNRKALAQFINMTIERHAKKDQRILIHLPYSWALDISQHLRRPNSIHHDKDTKFVALKKFKETPGSILIACGMAEGVDLKGDLCRLNIIPKVLWPNKKDDFVEKKSCLGPSGQLWYQLEAAKTVIQQAGRSTRGPDDWSTTVVLDPSFVGLISSVGSHLPHSFIEAIQFHS